MDGRAVTAAAERSRYAALLAELRATLTLALPLALTQVAQIGLHTTEVVLLGRLGPEPLAGASLAASLYHLAFLLGLGVVSATAPLVAQALGAGRRLAVRRAVRQGLWVTLALSLPAGAALFWAMRPFLALIGQDPALLPLAEAYIRAAVWGLPFGVGFVVLRSFTSAFGRTRAILLVTVAAVLLNIPLSWALIFGRLGAPALGVTGAGIGVAFTNALMFLFLLVYCLRTAPFRRYAVLARFHRPDWPTFREVLRVGLPIGGAILMESGLFSTATLLMGLIGTAQLAGHQVTLQLAATAFMVPLGIGNAATIRVGLAAGALDPAGVRRAGWTAYGLGVSFTTVSGLVFWVAAEPLVALFLTADTPEAAAARAHAAGFLRIAAIFQIVDGVQVIGISALRGLKDTTVPMWLAALGYWAVGFPACVILAFGTPLEGAGIWLGLALALAVAALVLLRRFARLTAGTLPLAQPATVTLVTASSPAP